MADSRKNIRVIVAGGGTGGHLYPAVSIAGHLRNDGASVRYIGSKFGLEAKKETLIGHSPLLLPITGIQRDFSLRSNFKNLIFPFRFIYSYFKSRQFIKKFKPQVVIGTGGYSSGIPLLNAIGLGIKTLIQEQNSYPGITTRKLSGKVNTVCIAYDESRKYLTGNIIRTGNPVRQNLIIQDKQQSREIFELDPDKKTILILGGSQGSRPLNMHFLKNYQNYISNDIQIIWQCGFLDEQKLESVRDLPSVRLHPFIENMSSAYSAADIVICRAGAITLAEVVHCKRASVLIPFPFAAGNHQEVNAITFENNGASIMVRQNTLESGELEKVVFRLFNDKARLQSMEHAASRLSIPDAGHKIINEVYKLI